MSSPLPVLTAGMTSKLSRTTHTHIHVPGYRSTVDKAFSRSYMILDPIGLPRDMFGRWAGPDHGGPLVGLYPSLEYTVPNVTSRIELGLMKLAIQR